MRYVLNYSIPQSQASPPYLNGIEFVDPWSKVVGVSPEGDLQQGEELVHASQ